MPELPEVETVAKGLQKAIAGKRIAAFEFTRKDLRIPFPQGFSDAAEGSDVQRVYRRAKYLIIELSGGISILAHLGMSGQFLTFSALPSLQTHDHVVFQFADGSACVYRDPRRFGLLTYTQTAALGAHPLLKDIGPEPFSDAFHATYLARELKRRKQSVKAVLLDQTLVAGVGNIYASEACFLARIHPLTPAKDAVNKAQALVLAVREVLQKAIQSGGSSLRDFVNVDGNTGYFQHAFAVYGRAGAPCNACKTPISACMLAGRNTFWCPQCQRKKL
jgi:formamidopyrimidine-DNA glycosylase